jgi:hypothetical protein
MGPGSQQCGVNLEKSQGCGGLDSALQCSHETPARSCGAVRALRELLRAVKHEATLTVDAAEVSNTRAAVITSGSKQVRLPMCRSADAQIHMSEQIQVLLRLDHSIRW